MLASGSAGRCYADLLGIQRLLEVIALHWNRQETAPQKGGQVS
jgi:hypothetical protein